MVDLSFIYYFKLNFKSVAVKNVCGYDIKLGTSLEKLSNVISTSDLKQYIELYKNKNYLLIPNIKTRTIYVAIKKGEKSEDLLTAYFHSVMLGIALCYYNSAHLVSPPIYFCFFFYEYFVSEFRNKKTVAPRESSNTLIFSNENCGKKHRH